MNIHIDQYDVDYESIYNDSKPNQRLLGIELICLTPNKIEFIYDVQNNIIAPVHQNEICYSGNSDNIDECGIGDDDIDADSDVESTNFIIKHAKYKSIDQHLKKINVTLQLPLTLPVHLRYSLPVSYAEYHQQHNRYDIGSSSSTRKKDSNDDYQSVSSDKIVMKKSTLYKRIPLPTPHIFMNQANKLIRNDERYVSINKMIKREDHNHYDTKKFVNVYYDTTRLNHTGNYDDYYRLFINHYQCINVDYSKLEFTNNDSKYLHIPIGNSDNLDTVFISTILVAIFTSLYLFYIIFNIKRDI